MRSLHWSFVVGTLFLVGCASEPISLTGDGKIAVENVSSAAGHVWWADVRASAQQVRVVGEFIRRPAWPVDRLGHMDIEVLVPNNAKTTITNVMLVPVQTAGGDSRRLAFTVPLAQRPPPGSTVRVIHHAALGAGETGPVESGGT